MNKKRNIAMSIIAAGALALSMTAGCHTHTYSTSWSSDSTQHWHDATCGHDVTSDAANHTYTSSVTTAATCTTDGVTTYTCSVCGYTYTAPISATGHDYEAAYEWNTDGTVKSLTLTCKNDSTHVVEVAVSDVTVTADTSVAVAAEEYKPGVAGDYTASYTYGGVTYTDTYTATTAALGHDYTITVDTPVTYSVYLDQYSTSIGNAILVDGVVCYPNHNGTYVPESELVQGTDYYTKSERTNTTEAGVEYIDFTAPADGTYTFTVTADSYGYVRINDSEYDIYETIGYGQTSYTCTIENVTGGDELYIMATIKEDATLYSATSYTYTLHVGYEGDGTSSGGGDSGDSGDTSTTGAVVVGTTYTAELSDSNSTIETTLTIPTTGYYTVTFTGSNCYVTIEDDNYTYYYNNNWITSTNYIVDYSITSSDVPISIPAGTVLNVTISGYSTATLLVELDEDYEPTTIDPVVAGTTYTAELDENTTYLATTLTIDTAGYYKVTATGSNFSITIMDDDYAYYYSTYYNSRLGLDYILDYDTDEVVSVAVGTVLNVSIYASSTVTLLVELDADYEPSTSSGDTYDYTLTGSTFTADLTGGESAYSPASYEIYVSVAGTYTFTVDEDGDISVEVNGGDSTSVDEGGSDSFTVAVGDIITVKAYADTTLTVTSIVTLGDNTIKITETDSWGYSESITKTFTATTTGLYVFSIESGADAYIYVASNSANVYYGSNSSALSTSCYLVAGDTISIKFNTYSDSVGEYTFTIATGTITEDTLATDGTATTLTMIATADTTVQYAYLTLTTGTLTDTNYYIAFDCSSSYSKGYISAVEVTVDGTAATTAGLYCNLTLASDTTYSIVVKFTASSFSTSASYTATLTQGTYVPVTTSVNSETDSEKYALVEGNNTIALSTADASGITMTYTAAATGIYTFEIVSGEGAKVTVGTIALQVTSSSSSTLLTTSVYLEKDASVTLKFCTYSGEEGTYTLKLTKSDVSYEAITLGTTASTTAITKYTNGASTNSAVVTYLFVTYTVPSDAATAYYLELTSSNNNYWNYYINEDAVSISVNGATAVDSTDFIFNLTLTAGETYNFVIAINTSLSSSYTMYASLYEGTYVPTVTTINGSESGTLTTGTSGNAIVLSGSDASSGYALTFTADAAGTYTFTIDETADADIYIAESESAYKSWNYDNIYGDSDYLTASIDLKAGDTLYVLLKSNSKSEATYTLTITYTASSSGDDDDEGGSSSGDTSVVPTTLSVGDNQVTIIQLIQMATA